MAYTHILYAVADGVATIRLNDPATLNALSLDMGRELLDAIGRAEREARAILLGGEGRGFCSGANLAEGGARMADPDRDMGARLEEVYNPIMRAMRGSPLPIVTAVRGPAAGIGFPLALTGDIVVAGEGAYFLQAFRHIGLVPDGGSTYQLVRSVGRVRAMEMMLLGERIPAAQALDWGLVTRVVADAEVDTAALGIATALARGPRSLGMIKRIAWAAADATFEEALATERDAQREAGHTADFLEGVTAFLEKRPAVFRGE